MTAILSKTLPTAHGLKLRRFTETSCILLKLRSPPSSPEFQTHPVTTGAIFHKLSPKLQYSRYPFSPTAQQSAETTEADWRCTARETERKGVGEEDGERAREREREGGRERERKGQTPQQQAWETSEITRDLENSHNKPTLREHQISRDLPEVE